MMFLVRPYSTEPPIPASLYAGLTGITYGANHGVLSLRFDDGAVEDYSVVFPLLEARSLVGGFAVIRTLLGASGRTTPAQCAELQTAGHEIMCHTLTHSSEPANYAAFCSETAVAGWEMRALGFRIWSFVQSGMWTTDYPDGYNINSTSFYDSPEDQLLCRHFAAYEAYAAPADSFYPWRYDLPRASRKGVKVYTADEGSLEDLTGWIDDLISNGQGGTALFHGSQIDDGSHISLADFASFLDYAAAAVAAGTLTVLTPTQQLYATEAA